jgi:hypothetical protein
MENILGIYVAKSIGVKRRKVLQYEGLAHLPHVDGLTSLTTIVTLACSVCLAYGKAVMPTDVRCSVSDM